MITVTVDNGLVVSILVRHIIGFHSNPLGCEFMCRDNRDIAVKESTWVM